MKQYSLFGQDDSPTHLPIQLTEVNSKKPSTIAFYIVQGPDRSLGFSFCYERYKAYYLSLQNTASGFIEDVFSYFVYVFNDSSVQKITFDAKPLLRLCLEQNIQIQGQLHDLQIAYWLLDPNKTNVSLQFVAQQILGIDLPMEGTSKNYKNLSNHTSLLFENELEPYIKTDRLDLQYVSNTACLYADTLLQLKDKLLEHLDSDSLKIYYDIELPLAQVLAQMQYTGIKIDTLSLATLSKELNDEMSHLQDKIYSLAGQDFNINSPKQLGFILFEKLGLKPIRKTKTGFSTDNDVLQQLAAYHDLPATILKYRFLHKLKTTYADALPTYVNKRTARLHTTFNQTSTATGRISSIAPNLQNIPIKTEWGERIRSAFVAEKGHLLLSADYSQVELRILAHLSGDSALLHAFEQGIDVHAMTAMSIFNVNKSAVTKDMRRVGKTINFGVIYGMSPYGLAESLSISQKDAADYINRFFDIYSGVREYVQKCIDFAKKTGYSVTIMGRKRPIPELMSANKIIRQTGERLAINTPIQGSTADIIKIAMINIYNIFRKNSFSTKMLLQIHDELLFEVPEYEIEAVKPIVKECMQNAFKLSVPLIVDIGIAKDWCLAY